MPRVLRLQMVRSLREGLPALALPTGYRWLGWNDSLLEAHADVQCRSFQGSVDAAIFPNLASRTGCRLLIRDIRDSAGFCPRATLLITAMTGPVAAIQCLLDPPDAAAIQNVSVLPDHRQRGLGQRLVARAMAALAAEHARVVWLEVTASNRNAVRLYHRLGFRVYNSYHRRFEQAAPAWNSH